MNHPFLFSLLAATCLAASAREAIQAQQITNADRTSHIFLDHAGYPNIGQNDVIEGQAQVWILFPTGLEVPFGPPQTVYWHTSKEQAAGYAYHKNVFANVHVIEGTFWFIRYFPIYGQTTIDDDGESWMVDFDGWDTLWRDHDDESVFEILGGLFLFEPA